MTSMNKEYLKLYTYYSGLYGPNTCVFLMVGKFYELYDSIDPVTGEGATSMKRAVDLLNIQVTLKKGKGPEGHDSILAGVPEQSLHKFASVLTRNNWTVVVCDQVMSVAGKVEGRPVARILSPGTHIETATADAPYVAAVWLEEREWQKGEPPAYGIAFFDLTTGHTSGFEGIATGSADVWAADLLVHSLQIQNPREIVVFWRGGAAAKPTESMLRSRFGGVQSLFHLRMANAVDQGGFETSLVREEFLTRLYEPESMLPIREFLRIQETHRTERALIGLLRFIEDHLPSSLEHLQPFAPWTPKDRVHLGNNALTQLNCTGLRIEDSVLGLFQKTITAPGKRQLRDRLLTPISDIETLRLRLNRIEAILQRGPEFHKKVERSLRQIFDFPRLHRKILVYSLVPADILALQETYLRIKELAILFQGTLFEMDVARFQSFLDYQKLFHTVFDAKKAARAIDESEFLSFLSDSRAPKTAAVEQILQTLYADVKKKAEDLCIWANLPIDALRIEVGKESQVYSITGTKTTLTLLKKIASQRPTKVEDDEKQVSVSAKLKKGSLVATPRAAIHECPLPDMDIQIRKTTNGSVDSSYIEGIHHHVTKARQQLAAAVEEEIVPLCTLLIEEAGQILWTFLEDWVSEIDMSLCLAKVADVNGFKKPTFIDDEQTKRCASVHVEGLRHPLIELSCQRQQYVQHTVSLGSAKDDSAGWLVYGMNASGKSSLMKSLGIAVVLAQCGSYVPATTMVLRPFHSILTRILNQDNLWAGLSSFAVEMSELRDILLRADPFSLVLGDELCSGTESISATALVASGIQQLLSRGSRFIFATHLHGLMNLPQITEQKRLGIWHLKVNYDAGRDLLIYDRALHKGPGSNLYGIEVARALHLPVDFLEGAHKIRRHLLGEKTEEDATASQWNSQVRLRACELCRHPIARDLEVHHIRPRVDANGKHFTDGSGRDATQNLIVVCSMCHDKHHAGQLEIPTLQVTSAGLKRVSDTASVTSESTRASGATKASKWTDEQREIILNTLRRQPNTPLRRIMNELEHTHSIVISESTLKAFRQKGDD